MKVMLSGGSLRPTRFPSFLSRGGTASAVTGWLNTDVVVCSIFVFQTYKEACGNILRQAQHTALQDKYVFNNSIKDKELFKKSHFHATLLIFGQVILMHLSSS
jgi:hypothetical protein